MAAREGVPAEEGVPSEGSAPPAFNFKKAKTYARLVAQMLPPEGAKGDCARMSIVSSRPGSSAAPNHDDARRRSRPPQSQALWALASMALLEAREEQAASQSGAPAAPRDPALQAQLDALSAAEVDWIYLNQTPRADASAADGGFAGFEGGTYSGPHSAGVPPELRSPSLPMTFAALALLVLKGDDLSRVDTPGILNFIRRCGPGSGKGATWDGSFCGCLLCPEERDLRMGFSAVATCHLLRAPLPVPAGPIADFAWSCQAWDGAFGLSPAREGHGGSTHCAVATLFLLGGLPSSPHPRAEGVPDAAPDALASLTGWLAQRFQNLADGGGVNGRPGKPADVCYSWWVSASLMLLGRGEWVTEAGEAVSGYVKRSQHPLLGGVGKDHTCAPDPMHAYYALAGMALADTDALPDMDPALHLPASATQAAGVGSGCPIAQG